MVKKIKKKRPAAAKPGGAAAGSPTWYVPFDAQGQAAIFIHGHGDTDDHSGCGPVVMCCERAQVPYRALAPELCARIDQGLYQTGDHLSSWLEGGVGAMYFVLCDPDDPNAIYQFGLPAPMALDVLSGRRPAAQFRRPDLRHSAASPAE